MGQLRIDGDTKRRIWEQHAIIRSQSSLISNRKNANIMINNWGQNKGCCHMGFNGWGSHIVSYVQLVKILVRKLQNWILNNDDFTFIYS